MQCAAVLSAEENHLDQPAPETQKRPGLPRSRDFLSLCKDAGILMNPSDRGVYRVVTHVGVEKEDLDVLIDCIHKAL